MLDGQPFNVFTDHKVLTYTLSPASDPSAACQSRQVSYVAEFTSGIQYIAGAPYVVANTLTSLPGHVVAGGGGAILCGNLCKRALQVSGCHMRRGKQISSPLVFGRLYGYVGVMVLRTAGPGYLEVDWGCLKQFLSWALNL
jgi:hypothetical protein